MNDTEKSKMGFIKRVAGTIVNPSSVMQSLREKPRVLFPIIIMCVVQVLYLIVHFSLYSEYNMNVLKASQQVMYQYSGVEYTPEMLEQMTKVQNISGLIMTPIGILFQWLAGTAILFGVIKIFKGEGRYKQYLSVTGYAYIILALYTVIKLVVTFISGELYLDTPLVSLGALFSEGATKGFFYAIACSIDLYLIWFYCLVAIGVATVSQLSKKKSYIIVASLFAAVLLFSGVISELSTSFI